LEGSKDANYIGRKEEEEARKGGKGRGGGKERNIQERRPGSQVYLLSLSTVARKEGEEQRCHVEAREEGGRRKEEGGRRKEEGGRRKEEGGGGRRKEDKGSRREGPYRSDDAAAKYIFCLCLHDQCYESRLSPEHN
jgi:hypothetical protein